MPILHHHHLKFRAIRPYTSKEKAFINDQLIPFYNKMVDKYAPNAIIFTHVISCLQLKELETYEDSMIKCIKSCLMCTDKGIVLQSMMANSRSLFISFRSIESIKFKPDNINARDNPDLYDRYQIRFNIIIHFYSPSGIINTLIVDTPTTATGVIRNMPICSILSLFSVNFAPYKSVWATAAKTRRYSHVRRLHLQRKII